MAQDSIGADTLRHARTLAGYNASWTAEGARSTWPVARLLTRRVGMRETCVPGCGLTLEFTCWRKRAKPAVASQVQRRVRRHVPYFLPFAMSASDWLISAKTPRTTAANMQ